MDYVYFIQCGGLVKIGSASDVRARLSNLQVASAAPLTLLAIIPNEAPNNEFALHKRFHQHHHRGEWFRLEGELASFVGDLPPYQKPRSPHAKAKARSFIRNNIRRDFHLEWIRSRTLYKRYLEDCARFRAEPLPEAEAIEAFSDMLRERGFTIQGRQGWFNVWGAVWSDQQSEKHIKRIAFVQRMLAVGREEWLRKAGYAQYFPAAIRRSSPQGARRRETISDVAC